jgi:sigma-E factor negative regulatory protein RseA
MKSRISAMMDGELPHDEIAQPLRAMREDPEACQSWRDYHLIGDALRNTGGLSSDFSARFAARLEEEPTVFSPASAPTRPLEQRRHWVALSAAASVAAVTLVGWLAFAPQQETTSRSGPIAQTVTTVVSPAAEAQNVPLPSETNDYLLAHQNYSPRSTLQGVAPYVRTVSESIRSR